MHKIDSILRARERAGLLTSYGARLFLALFIMAGHVMTHHSDWEVFIVLGTGSILVIITLVLAGLVYLDRALRLAGYVGILLDALIMTALPYIWYSSVGGYEKVPPAYLLKTSLALWAYCFIAISALALRPAYPLLLTIYFTLLWDVILLIVFNDPRTVITADFVKNNFSEAIIPAFHRFPQIAAWVLGGILVYITRSYRRNLHKAVALELSKNQLARYFSPNIVDTLGDAEANPLRPGGQRQDVVVLFADIRGFTELSEASPPEEVVEMLSDFHQRMVQAVFKNGGTLDKFIGDAIMVTFGTPRIQGGEADQALAAALEMLVELANLNQERASRGLAGIHMGIGMHYGPAIVGNIGTPERLEFTVIGDTVNVAARLESASKTLQTALVVSDDLIQQCRYREHGLRPGPAIALKGRSAPIRIWLLNSGQTEP
ncbi:MAG: adenylate/guanylate cyclase domain-containing protein [Leptospiraceae bacterium]|nr:adenylate/guanylate cyclase domain-containing protein [Leptospiraceae bacterium]